MKTKIMEGQSRAEIAKALPCAIRAALASYQRFTEQEELGDAKEFKAHHDACKVAIAHIELLLKLADSVGAEKTCSDDEYDQNVMSRMIESAREVHMYETKLEAMQGDER